jgi:tetratricopeptide (TPR) repeat protein
MRAGLIGEALGILNQVLEILPDYADAVAVRAELLDMLGKPAEAASEYERSRRLWASQRAGAPDRSYVFRQHGRFTFEVEAYELALARIRTGSFPLLACGNVLLAQGYPADALRCYDRALKLKPGNPDLMAMRGEALSMLGRYRQAVDAFDLALAGNPNSPETLGARGIAHAALGELGKANADWRLQLDVLPSHQFAARAYVRLRMADYAAAAPELERAVASFRDDPYWHLYHLTALRRSGATPDKIEVPARQEWPAPLIALHAGTIGVDAVLQRADTRGRRAEAAFQLAVLSLPADRATAAKRWKEVLGIGSPAMIEFSAALHELPLMK